jgi:glycosyltransferase involved in cell wall biosynthesis
VYESLAKQTYRDFEWLVVNDGSTDNTEEVLIALRREANFPVRVITQKNAGKCAGINRAAQEAKGRFFAFLDSDDEYTPTALESLKRRWDTIPDDEKPFFSAVSGLTRTPQGEIVGSKFPSDPIDSNSLEIRFRYRVRGEKSGFQRTDVLRQFPFEVFKNENAIAESLVYHRIALRYKTRYVNEVIRIYHDTPSSWGDNSMRIRARCSQGYRLYYREFVGLPYPIPLMERLKGYVNFIRTSFHARVKPLQQLSEAPSRWLCLACLPLGFAVYWNDRRRLAAG